jgi:hypothetical protein
MYELGCGAADITPTVGLPLSGFIFRENKPSTGVDTPLLVKALAWQSAGETFLLINYDLLGVSAPLEQQILGELQHHLGVARQQCVLVATHTHSAPPAAPLEGEADPDPAFWQLLGERTVEAARSALASLQPATLFQAKVRVPDLTYNRRAVLADGRVSMALEPDAPVIERGPVDDRLTVLLWRNPQGRNVAAALHFACHGVAVCTQSIGGDIPGELSRRVGDMLGVPCLFLPAAGGDINPLIVSAGRADMLAWVDRLMAQLPSLPQQFQPIPDTPLQLTSADLFLDYAPLPARAEVEQRLAALNRIAQGDVLSPEVQAALRSLSNIMNVKPGQLPNPGKAAYAALALAKAGQRTLAALAADRSLSGCRLRLAVWRLGRTALVFVSAELFAVTGFRIQALRPDLCVLPVTCAAPLVGYVPDRRALEQGGYEVDDAWRFYRQPAPFAADSEERIINTLRGMLQ